MDKITHEIRLKNWTEICQQCQSRPSGMTVENRCNENGIPYQTLINLYLDDCVKKKKKLEIAWK